MHRLEDFGFKPGLVKRETGLAKRETGLAKREADLGDRFSKA